MSLEENAEKLSERLEQTALRSGRKASDIIVVAVTKGVSWENILLAYQLGFHRFGENYWQEAEGKFANSNIQQLQNVYWHFIGHLQNNKTAKVFPHFSFIQSVDSLKLAETINRVAEQSKTLKDILIQVNISEETTKYGIKPGNMLDFIDKAVSLPALSIRGLMGLSPLGGGEAEIRRCFKTLKALFETAKDRFQISGFSVLSMGMSGDYEIAVEEGSTMVRIGTALFGPRKL